MKYFVRLISLTGELFFNLFSASFGNPNGIPGGGPGSLLASMNVNGFEQQPVASHPPPPIPQQLGGVHQLNVSHPQTHHIISGQHVQNSALVQNSANIKLENGGSSNSAGVGANSAYYACASYSPPAGDQQQHQQQALLTANAYSKPYNIFFVYFLYFWASYAPLCILQCT